MTAEWQAIETAPKDSVILIRSRADGVLMAKWDGVNWWAIVTGQYGSKAFEWTGGEFDEPFVFAPVTHWMPLPPEPEEEEQSP